MRAVELRAWTLTGLHEATHPTGPRDSPELQEAARLCMQIRESEPNRTLALECLAEIAALRGQPTTVDLYLEEAARSAIRPADIARSRARLLLQMARGEDAFELLTNVDAQEREEDASLTHLLGLAHAAQGHNDEAIAGLRRTIAAEPSNVAAHLHLATILHNETRREEALATLGEGLERADGRRWRMRLLLARASIRATHAEDHDGRERDILLDESLTDIARAAGQATTDSARAEVDYHRGVLLHRRGHYVQAQRALRQSVKRDRNREDASHALALLKEKPGTDTNERLTLIGAKILGGAALVLLVLAITATWAHAGWRASAFKWEPLSWIVLAMLVTVVVAATLPRLAGLEVANQVKLSLQQITPKLESDVNLALPKLPATSRLTVLPTSNLFTEPPSERPAPNSQRCPAGQLRRRARGWKQRAAGRPLSVFSHSHNAVRHIVSVSPLQSPPFRLLCLAMHIDPYIVLGSAVVGFLVGMTGAGGGALMTPMLILLFGVQPSAAISSDLVAAVVMRPIGAAVHLRRATVNLRLVRWMVLGSVPMAFAGAYLLHLLGNSKSAQQNVQLALGIALLVGAGALVLRYVLDARTGQRRTGHISDVVPRPLPTIPHRHDRRPRRRHDLRGLRLAHDRHAPASSTPRSRREQLVGTDLTQAVPLIIAAALGALAFGHVSFGVTASLIIGSVPAVLIGSLVSSSAPDRYIRPVITFVIAASGLEVRRARRHRARLDPLRRPLRRRRHLARLPSPPGPRPRARPPRLPRNPTARRGPRCPRARFAPHREPAIRRRRQLADDRRRAARHRADLTRSGPRAAPAPSPHSPHAARAGRRSRPSPPSSSPFERLAPPRSTLCVWQYCGRAPMLRSRSTAPPARRS